ncbi:MAG: tripartite tricarboxylate transporter substrate binding protein [Hyphomicrobiaceae bacterium]|nr:tripartite tricarboxylate transporter substrate binding protein [Hyphomicrobiaceae bacterium]
MRWKWSLPALAAAMLALAAPAKAQTWPARPVKIIVPFAAGGGTDAIARPWAEQLSQHFGQPFVIENRGGASGIIGVEAVIKSSPDGYTLLVAGNSPLTLQPILRKTTWDPRKDLVPIARLGDLVTGFAVHPSTGIKSMPELLDYARKHPGKLSFASAGQGSGTHLRLEALKLQTGVDILHVPYRGSADGLTDLLAGNVQIMNEIVVLPHAKAGKLTMLAMNHTSRHPEFPDVPTLTEVGVKNADLPIWMSMWAPAGTPAGILERLNAKIAEIARTPDMKTKMLAISVDVPVQSPAEIAVVLSDEMKRNEEIIKKANIKVE